MATTTRLAIFGVCTGLLLAVPIVPGLAQDKATATQQDRMKSCNAEARTQKLKGDARKTFMSDCLKGSAPPSTQNSTTQNSTPSPNRATGTSQPPPAQRAPGATATAAGAGQFASVGDAQRHCPRDTVVWANTASKIYHYSGNKNYGNTKGGAYMCQQDSDRNGFRPAKNEKAPAKP